MAQARQGRKFDLGNGVSVEMLLDDDGNLLGLGGAWAAGVALRSAAVPLAPYLKSDRGFLFTHFRLGRTEALGGGGHALHTVATGIPTLEAAYEDEYNTPQVLVGEADAETAAEVVWLLRPETLRLHETAYAGFSYAWQFSSPSEKLYRVLAKGTWELGGRAEGNTILSLGQVTPAVYTARRETHFTSACLKRLDRFGDPLGMSYQLTPRLGIHQCFDFIGHASGTLLGYWPERADVRSFVQKNPGEDVIFVVDATHFELAGAVETPRKCILFAPAEAEGMPEHVMRNRWKDAHDFCGESARRLFGVKRSRPLPEGVFAAADGPAMRLLDDGRLEMRVHGRWVPSQEYLPALADADFAEFAARGIRRAPPAYVSETDPSERGLVRKLDRGLHGDLNVGSVCCVHRYVPSAMWGGMAAWQYYYRRAREHGLEAGIWVGPHLSQNAPIVKAHPDWMACAPTTMPASGGYPDPMTCMNWGTGVRQWVFDDLRRWKEEGGLDYIWFDSLGNLGMFPVDFVHRMQGSTFALAEFFADLQTIGIATIEVEGSSPFGTAAYHLFDPNRGRLADVQGIVGQNTLDWYAGNEDMLCDQQPRLGLHRDRGEEEVRQMFFRFLANRAVPQLGRHSVAFGPRPEWFRAYLDTYFVVEDDLVRRHLLPGRRGVRWSGGGADILFAFEGFPFDVGGVAVERIAGGAPHTVVHAGVLQAEPWTVYRMH